MIDDTMFDSGWVTLEEHNLFVSRAILQVCNAIQAKFPSLEWAILLKGEWTRHGFEIGLTYAIPKQTVASGSVKFDDEDVEKYKVDGYNVIVHSHHNMGIGFSGSDIDTLTDSSFAASLLYAKGEIKTATCSIKVREGVRVAIEPKVVVLDFLAELPEWIEKVITKSTPIYNYGNHNYHKIDNWEDKWTKRRWNSQKQCFEKIEKIWNKKKTQWDWEDEIEDDLNKIVIRLDDGTLVDEKGLPTTEEELKGVPHTILTEDEDINRQIPDKLRGRTDLDYSYEYMW